MNKNHGVILGTRSSDFAEGTLPYEIRVADGNWMPWLPEGELQRGKEDYAACVTYSALNSIEMQEKFLTGVESNYCDREVALKSGTTRDGNYLYKVADYIRNTGLGQQSTYPSSGGTFDEEYAPIPADIQQKLNAEKTEWLTKWDIKHEDIPYDHDSLRYHLKHAPIQVVIPGHAIACIFDYAGLDRIFDSYPPYVKTVPGTPYQGPIVFAKKIVLYKKENAPDPDTLFVDINFGESGPSVAKLKRALIRIGWTNAWVNGVKIDVASLPDVYGTQMAGVVYGFQLANLEGWARIRAIFFNKGQHVDQDTRLVINKLLTIRK